MFIKYKISDPTIRSLYERKSVRVFTGEHIPEDDVRIIAEAAAQAPTAGNQQLYTILRITNPEKKHRLSISCDNQPFIEEADLILVFCADCLRWYRAYEEARIVPRKPGEGDDEIGQEVFRGFSRVTANASGQNEWCKWRSDTLILWKEQDNDIYK